MLRNLLTVLLLMLVAVTAAEAAGIKIGVVDMEKAIMQTAKARNMSEQFVKDFTQDAEREKKLAEELKALNDKRVKEGASMSKTDQEALIKQMQSKGQQRAEITKKIKQAEQNRLQDLRKAVDPKLKEVMKEVAVKGGYTIIVERMAAPYYSEADDVTQAVTEKLNQTVK